MQNLRCKLFMFSNPSWVGNCRPLINAVIMKPMSTEFHGDEDEPENKISHWMSYNEKVYPPQDPSEPRRPAFVCHEIKKIKYSPKKMWYIACFVRGMSVDEALKQLQCIKTKGAGIVKEAIEETMDIAVREHNVEFRSNLWVAESFSGTGGMIKGIRRCAKGKITVIRYRYCNYYLRLEEGQPPEDYYCKKHLEPGPQLLEKWLADMRKRKIINSL